MKPSLTTAILAALFAPVTAFADIANVDIYGNFDVSYDSINTGTATKGTQGTTSARISSNTSFLGVKGTVDAGSGLKALWQAETLINVGNTAANANNNGGTLGNRNTYVGLKSEDYGTLVIGRYDTPYRLSTRLFDAFDRGIADNRSILGGSNVAAKISFDGRQDQLIGYTSPNLHGALFSVARANLNPTVNLGGQYQGNATSLAAWYRTDGYYGTLAYERHNLQNAANSSYLGSESAVKLGAGYTRDGKYTVGLFIEQTKDNIGTGGANLYGHSTYYLSGKYFTGEAGAIKAAYTRAGNLGGGNTANTGATQTTVGYDYYLNKRVTLYALYTRLNNAPAANYSLSIYNGTAASVGGPGTIAGTGASPSALAAGMLITF